MIKNKTIFESDFIPGRNVFFITHVDKNFINSKFKILTKY